MSNTTENKYVGNGSTVLYSFTFPYIDESDVKVSINQLDTTGFSLANPTTIEFDTAPSNGVTIRIYRQTPTDSISSTFFPGSTIRAQDLNDNFEQTLYLVQESQTIIENSDAASVIGIANEALDTANQAEATANAISGTANAALSAANAADTKADQAIENAATAQNTAITAKAIAEAALGPDSVISDLSDVSSDPPESGQALVWDGAIWSPGDVASGDGGGDTIINYSGASAWGDVAADGTLKGGLNVSVSGNYPYVVTFNTPMPDANYAVVFGGYTNAAVYGPKTANGFEYYGYNANGSGTSSYSLSFAVFATNALPPRGGTGTDSWGSVQADGTIDASFNVASITKTGTGKYDVVFTTPMPTANYAVTGSCRDSTDVNMSFVVVDTLVSGFTYTTIRDNQAGIDLPASFTVNCTNATLPQTVTQAQIDAAIYNPGAAAWGYSETATDTLLSGNNIESIKYDVASAGWKVTFSTPMPNANYAAFVTGNYTNGYEATIDNESKTPTSFLARFYNAGAIAAVPYINVVVFATNALPPRGGTGTDAWGSVKADGTLDASFNVASVTRDSAGNYAVVFTTPMPTASYAVNATNNDVGTTAVSVSGKTVNGFNVTLAGSASGTDRDTPFSFTVNCTSATLPSTFTKEEIQSVLDFIKTGGNAPVAILQDIQPASTNSPNGGAGWKTRVFNTEDDAFNLVSLAASGEEFTLQPGAYLIDWFVTSLQTSYVQSRLTNVTAGSTAGLGSSQYSNAAADYCSVESTGAIRVQITTTSTFKIEQFCSGNSGYGHGIGSGSAGPNLFAQVKIQGTTSV